MGVQFNIEQDPDGTLEITAYTDAPYSPDVADDLASRALNLWKGALESVQTDLPETP